MAKQLNLDPPDRRSGIERREYNVDIGFPFVDTHGHLVEDERRKLADRRAAYTEFREEKFAIEKLSEQSAR